MSAFSKQQTYQLLMISYTLSIFPLFPSSFPCHFIPLIFSISSVFFFKLNSLLFTSLQIIIDGKYVICYQHISRVSRLSSLNTSPTSNCFFFSFFLCSSLLDPLRKGQKENIPKKLIKKDKRQSKSQRTKTKTSNQKAKIANPILLFCP